MGLMAWLRGGSSQGVGGALGAFDAIFNPAAARAREELDRQHEQVMPTPSPGDRLLDEGRIVIDLPPNAPDDQRQP